MDEQNLDQGSSEQPVSQPSVKPFQSAPEEVSQAPISQPVEAEVPVAPAKGSEKAPVDFEWKKPVIIMLVIGIVALAVSFILNIK